MVGVKARKAATGVYRQAYGRRCASSRSAIKCGRRYFACPRRAALSGATNIEALNAVGDSGEDARRASSAYRHHQSVKRARDSSANKTLLKTSGQGAG